jgi:hypothetical protein
VRYALFAVLVAVPVSLVTWMLTRGGACPRPEVFVTAPKGEVARAGSPAGAGGASTAVVTAAPAGVGGDATGHTAAPGATASGTSVPAAGAAPASVTSVPAAGTAPASVAAAAGPAPASAALTVAGASPTPSPAAGNAATTRAAADAAPRAAPARAAVEAAFARPVGGATLEGGALTWYDSKGLFDYIDGGAPLYIEKGFVRLAAAELRSSSGGEISADCYDMGGTAGALAVYASSRSASAKPAGVGDEGQVSRMGLDFRKGRWYVKLTAFDPKSEAALPAIAKDIAARLP